MFKNEIEWNRVKIAYKTCNEKELEALAKDENDGVKIAVANNKNTTSKILEFLSEDNSWWVRIAVAKHKNTNPDTLHLSVMYKEEIPPMKLVHPIDIPPSKSSHPQFICLYFYIKCLK